MDSDLRVVPAGRLQQALDLFEAGIRSDCGADLVAAFQEKVQ